VYGASGDLRKRVQDGAPIDAVLFAAPEPVDQLIASRHVVPDTRKVVAHNRLVLVGPRGGVRVGWQSLEALPPGEKLAIGEPNVVPAGTYAKRALEALGKWDALKDRLLFGGDVAAVLAYVRRGEVAAGIVYATEARGIEDVVVLEEASGPWAPLADVVVGATVDVAGASHSGPARSFLEFLMTTEAQAIFRQYGFETDG
jgi:molybdate transport system substrate-binding protein